MEKYIKYLNYKVYHDGVLSHEGTVPSIHAFSGIEKKFNLGGVWLWHTSPQLVTLELTDGVKTYVAQSDNPPHEWLNYCATHRLKVSDPWKDR